MWQRIFNKNGQVIYLENWLSDEIANLYFYRLQKEIPWKNDRVKIFGKEIEMRRQSAWFSENNQDYTYSGITNSAVNFPSVLLEIKHQIEAITQEKFNSCLANFYFDGNDGMGFHADNEKEIVKNSTIASVSFGADRKFVFRHNQSKEKHEILLQNGSLLLMKDEIQQYWKHALPKSKKINQPRINLTFRQIITK